MKIRKLKQEDLPIRVQWMNHPQVYQSMHFSLPVMLDKTEEWYLSNLSNASRFDAVFCEHDEIVAMGGLTHVDSTLKKAELYIFVDPLLQKSGLGTQATHLLCDYGFSVLGLNKIYLITNEDNIPAQRVYEKCGFVLEGKMRNEYVNPEGIYMCRLYYGLLKNEWDEISR